LPAGDAAGTFTALLQGFLQAAQAPGATLGAPATLVTDGSIVTGAETGTGPPAQAVSAGSAELPALPAPVTGSAVLAPITLTPTASAPAPLADPGGNGLPPTGSSPPQLVVADDREAGLRADAGSDLPPAGAPGEQFARPATPRISLADLQLSRELALPAASGLADSRVGSGDVTVASAADMPLPAASDAGDVTVRARPAADGLAMLRLDTLLLPGQRADAGGLPATTGSALTDAAGGHGGGTAGLASGTSPTQSLRIFGDPVSWSQNLGQRMLTMSDQGIQSARLQLYPEHLGALDIEVQVDDGVAQVWFGTHTSHAREAIEAAMPRLREMFAEQGITLARTHVESGSGQRGDRGNPFAGAGDAPRADPGVPSASTALLAAMRPSGAARLLDVWA
jgi:hypothetical protein